jgi:hypothetical protein
MAIRSVTYRCQVTTVETISTGAPAATGAADITHTGYDSATVALSPTSTPTATAAVYASVALTAGAATLDLTALTGPGGAAVTMTGLKGRLIRITNPSSNANSVTVSKGASNGFTGLGTSFSVTIPVGGEFTFYDGGNGVAVSGTVKTLDFAGTGTQAFQVTVVAGG